jgi:hypothetical protein
MPTTIKLILIPHISELCIDVNIMIHKTITESVQMYKLWKHANIEVISMTDNILI